MLDNLHGLFKQYLSMDKPSLYICTQTLYAKETPLHVYIPHMRITLRPLNSNVCMNYSNSQPCDILLPLRLSSYRGSSHSRLRLSPAALVSAQYLCTSTASYCAYNSAHQHKPSFSKCLSTHSFAQPSQLYNSIFTVRSYPIRYRATPKSHYLLIPPKQDHTRKTQQRRNHQHFNSCTRNASPMVYP